VLFVGGDYVSSSEFEEDAFIRPEARWIWNERFLSIVGNGDWFGRFFGELCHQVFEVRPNDVLGVLSEFSLQEFVVFVACGAGYFGIERSMLWSRDL